MAQTERLRPFPDVLAALDAMRAHGLRLVILSDGDPDMLAKGWRTPVPSHYPPDLVARDFAELAATVTAPVRERGHGAR